MSDICEDINHCDNLQLFPKDRIRTILFLIVYFFFSLKRFATKVFDWS